MSWPRKREFVYMAIAAFLAVVYASAPQSLPAVTGKAQPPSSGQTAVLSFPLPYKAVVCMDGRCAYYFGKEQQ